jgi:hypothetical protein
VILKMGNSTRTASQDIIFSKRSVMQRSVCNRDPVCVKFVQRKCIFLGTSDHVDEHGKIDTTQCMECSAFMFRGDSGTFDHFYHRVFFILARSEIITSFLNQPWRTEQRDIFFSVPMVSPPRLTNREFRAGRCPPRDMITPRRTYFQ